MLPVWPSSINHLADRGSFQLQPSNNRSRTDFDDGPARSRRRFTKSVDNISFVVDMNEFEFAQFEGFYQDDLFSGNAWFTMPVYLARNGYEESKVRITQPYSVSDSGFNKVKVSMNLEKISAPLLKGGYSYLISEYGISSITEFNDLLDEAVNTVYTEAVENY